MYKKAIAAAAALSMTVNLLPISSAVGEQKILGVHGENTSTFADDCYIGTEHAYDPLAEYEEKVNEERFRESANIAENKVIFSMAEDIYENDIASLCERFSLHDVSLIYCAEKDDGSAEAFCEAYTSAEDIWNLTDEMTECEKILSAEPVFVWEKASVGEPAEVSAEEFERETHYSLLETNKVWNSLKNSDSPGKGAVVAVIDTGVDYTHKDLAENIWVNSGELPGKGIDDDGNGYVDDIHGINAVTGSGDPMDDHGHGTHVAGVIAMTSGNGGGVGLAYGAEIMCIKAGGADGTFTSSDIIRAVKYAVDNGADVINMSFGGEERSSVVEAALNDASKYAVLVASAGNDGLPTSEAAGNGYKAYKNIYPAGYNSVIGVMASDNSDKLAGFSNWDYIAGKGCEYEMTAPGVDIYSTLPDGRYAIWSGTSMSSSCVAAAAALLRSEYPQKAKYDSRFITGQLINATLNRATADPAVTTLPEITIPTVTTTTTTTASVTTSTSSDASPLINADVDGKEGVDEDDFSYMLKALVGLDTLGEKGDVNCDGRIDMYDAMCILRLADGASEDEITGGPVKNDENISFDIPAVDIVKDGEYTTFTFNYSTNFVFKAASGQLQYNGKPYSGEFENIDLLESSNSDFVYEFNPENGKFVAYSESNGQSGSLKIVSYKGKEGSYSLDLGSLKFFDENGKEFKNFDLVDFNPELNYKVSSTETAAAGTPSSVAVYDKHVEYPRLNIIDSLTRNPEPDFLVLDVSKSDSTDISDVNNGDGIIQPGETVSLGISLWNKWGAASDVTVKIEAIGFDGKPNPYVEVLDSSVSLGDVAASSGAEASVRVKVKENAPNDGKMEFRLTVTAKNGFIPEDTAVYTSDSEYSFIVQRISYLRGKIKKDITLDPSRYWIVDGEVTLMDGVTMTIMPGTQVELKYDSCLNTDGGKWISKGTEEEPICIFGKGSIMAEFSSYLYYTEIVFVSSSLNYCDHCKIYGTSSSAHDINNSIAYIPYYQSSYWELVGCTQFSKAENCLFNNFSVIYGAFPHNHNVYLNTFDNSDSCDMNVYSSGSKLSITGQANAVLYSNSNLIDIYRMSRNNGKNYYGTDTPQIIGDYEEEELEFFTSDSYLTLDSPELESIYPFMTEAYITNERGERIENTYPGQTVFVHVKFNRDMATDIQPEVTVGRGTAIWRSMMDGYYTEMPSLHNYDDQIVTGDWISSREWVGYTSFDLSALEKGNIYENASGEHFIDDKELVSSRYYGIRSEGAVAADDRWLVTGNDGGRFGFNVVKPATIQTGDSETAKLSGKGIAGANQLNWEQAETETLAGYNLYRSTDGGVNFTKLNRSIISGEDLQYIDRDVEEGQKYSYYFTTVDTDFHESARSNVVECVPLDGEKPTIVHTPVTASEPDKAIVITANITDNVGIESVMFNYRYTGEDEWNSVDMRNPSGSVYKSTISAYEVREGELQYFIEVTDGVNTSYAGTPDDPMLISIGKIVTATSTTTTTTTTSTTSTSTATSTTSSTTSTSTSTTTTTTTTTTSSTITSTSTSSTTSTTSLTASSSTTTSTTTTSETTTTMTTTTTTVTSTAKIRIDKRDILDNEVVGAELTLKGVDKDGNSITFKEGCIRVGTGAELESGSGTELKWKSGTAPTTVTLGDGTYTLHEENAPDGYEVATDMVFVIEGGKLISVDEVPASSDDVVMIDDTAASTTTTSTSDITTIPTTTSSTITSTSTSSTTSTTSLTTSSSTMTSTTTSTTSTTSTTTTSTATSTTSSTTSTSTSTTTTTSTTSTTSTTMTLPPELLYGDVNCDGRVDMNDAETLSRWLEVPETVDISEQGMANADVYCPGSGLTAEDAETIVSFCKGLIPSLPVIPDPSIRRGDINEDGKINPVDASLILVKFADLSGTDTGSPSDATIRKYDINEDGRITAVDASLLLAYCADLAEDPDIQLLDFLAAHK